MKIINFKNEIVFILAIITLFILSILNFKVGILVYFAIAAVVFFRKPKLFIWFIVGIWPYTLMHGQFNEFIKIIGIVLFIKTIAIKRQKIKFYGFQITYFLFIVLGGISVLIATIMNDGNLVNDARLLGLDMVSIVNIFHFIFTFSLLMLVINYVDSENEVKALVRLFIFVGMIASIVGITIYLCDIYGVRINISNLIRVFPNGKTGVWDNRLAGVAYEPLAFGNIMGVLVPLSLIFSIIMKKKDRVMGIICLITSSMALLFTFSSGAWLSTVAVLIIQIPVIIIIFKDKIFTKKIISIVSLGILIIGITGYQALKISGNLEYVTFVVKGKFEKSQSLNERSATNSLLVQIYQDNKLMGVGIGRYSLYIDKYAPALDENYKFIPRPVPTGWRANNDYITILAEGGIIGMVTFIIMILLLYKDMILYMLKVNNRSMRMVALGLLASVSITLVQMIASFMIYNYYLWILIGLCYVLIKSKSEELV